MKISNAKKPLFALAPMVLLVACAGQQTSSQISANTNTDPEAVVPASITFDYIDNAVQTQDETYVQNKKHVQIEDEPETYPEENISQEEESTHFETGLASTEVETEATDSVAEVNELSTNDNEDNEMTTMVIESAEQIALANYHAVNDGINPEANSDLLETPTDEKFFFGFDKNTLSDDQVEKIKEKGKVLALNPQMKVTINGHTDSRGHDTYNRKLSLERAEFVAEILKEAGASASQIEVYGWGSDKPMVSDATYQENRRVEMTFENLQYAAY